MVVKEDADTVGFVLWQHLLGAPCFRAGFCSKTIIPDSEEHPLASSRAVPKAVLRWIRGTTKPKGTGLGLATCQEIVSSHKGTMYLMSVQGGGSTFTVRLPLNVDHFEEESE